MKKYLLLLFIVVAALSGYSQCGFTFNTIGSSLIYCQNALPGGIIVINPTGGIAPFTYQINNGTPQAGNTFTNLADGTYTVYVSDASPCTDSIVLNVQMNYAPILIASATPDTICPGGSTVLNGWGAMTVMWTGGVTNNSPFWPNATSTYTVTGTDVGGCTGSTTITVTVLNNVPLNTLSTNPPSCNPGCDGTAIIDTLAGAAPLIYTVNGGAINVFNVISNICANTNYTVTCTDNNGCSGSTNLMLTNVAPTVTLTNVTNVTCAGYNDGALNVTATGGNPPFTYTVVPLGPQGPGGNFNFLTAGGYTVTVTDANNCIATSVYVITEPPPYTVSIISITGITCNGFCDGSFIASATGVPPITFTLQPLNISNITGQFSGLCDGTYTVSVTDANNCGGGSTTVFLAAPPILTMQNTAFANPTCVGITDGTIDVSLNGGNLPYTFTLNPGAITNATGQFTNLSTGNYTISCSDANACSMSTIVTLSPPGINFTVNTINNLSCTCNGSVGITNVNGGVAPYNYTILPFANQPVAGTFDNMCGGVYTITISDANNCIGTTIINFNQIQLNASVVNSQCNGVNNGNITCTSLFGAAPYTYTLNPGNIVNASGVYNSLAAGTYTVNVVDANLCNNTVTVNILNNTQISVNAVLDSVICGMGGAAIFNAAGNAGGPYTYTVQPGNIVNINGIFNPLTAGNYTLTINNAAGCIFDNPFDIIQVSGLLPVAITSNVYDETCHLASDGAIDIVPANPGGLTYQWSNAAVTQDLANITTGNYAVLITDVNGDCITVYDTVTMTGINCGTISGGVYIDNNSNCILEPNDYLIMNTVIELSNGALAMTNMNGQFLFPNVPYGTFSIAQNSNPNYTPNACTQPASLTLIAGNAYLANVHYIDSGLIVSDAAVYIYTGGKTPGFNSSYHISVYNNSAFPITGNLNFVLDNHLSLINTNPINQGVYTVPDGDSIVWTNINIPALGTSHFYVNITTPVNTVLGTLIFSNAKFDVTNNVDYNLSNNSFESQSIVTGAYDPNDKSVNPIGEGPNGNITLQDSILNYNIRFQNTGTDSAHNIFILDTLSDKLDIKTLKVTVYSHPYKVEILNGNILKFKFDNIMLPDSNINEPLSHGFIAYSIEQKNTNQIGDVINNTAAIYFDFNAPIITNTTVNTIATPALISSPEFEKTIKVYPNPATDKLTVEFNSNSYGQSSITLTNTLGQVVKTVLANAINGKNKIELSVKELPKGIYLLKLSNGKYQNMKKVAIE